MEQSQANDALMHSAEGDFTGALRPIPTTPELRASGRRPPLVEEIRTRQCKLGDLRWLATVLRADICVRPAQMAARVRPHQGSYVYRIHD